MRARSITPPIPGDSPMGLPRNGRAATGRCAGAPSSCREAYEYTEINRSVSAGFQLKGRCWGRGEDAVGVAGVVSGLSNAAREYFSAGGIGIVIGDGALHYRPEQILETYYSLRVGKHTA